MSNKIRDKKCAIGHHTFKTQVKHISEARHLSYVRRIYTDYQPEYPVCETCYDNVIMSYNKKYAKAKALAKKKLNSVSTLHSSTNTSSDSSQTYGDIRKPLANLANTSTSDIENTTSTSDKENASASINQTKTRPPRTQFNLPAILAATVDSTSSTTGASDSTLDEGPSTSKAAAEARAEKTGKKKGGKAPMARAAAHIAEEDVAMDDDDFMPSPAALNGTRLPQVQPIIRKSTLVRAVPDVMAMYIADITGG